MALQRQLIPSNYKQSHPLVSGMLKLHVTLLLVYLFLCVAQVVMKDQITLISYIICATTTGFVYIHCYRDTQHCLH